MKKYYSLLSTLLLAAALMLSGCKASQDPSESPQQPDGNAIEETPQSTQTPDESSEKDLAVEATTLGVVDGNVYTNTYAGLGCKLDDSWTMVPAEELQDIPDTVAEMLKDTELEEDVAASPQIMDMLAQCPSTGASINVVYSQIPTKELLASRLMSEEQVIDSLLAGKDALISSYAATGLEVQSMEKATVDFLGKEHTACETRATMEGVELYIVQLLSYDLPGRYGMAITFSGLTEEDVEASMDSFYSLD